MNTTAYKLTAAQAAMVAIYATESVHEAVRRERASRAASKMLRRGIGDDAAIERVRERLAWANSCEAQSRLSSLLRALAAVKDARAEFDTSNP